MTFEQLIIIPFTVGIVYLFCNIIFRFTRWTLGLSKIDKIRIWKGLRTKKTLYSIKEAIQEGLFHRKIFQKNPVLGYMHMSLAFGWFLLIIVGHFETILHDKSLAVPFHKAVFFRYFITEKTDFFLSGFLAFFMDLLLLFVLSGVTLALFKRFRSKFYGMKKTTKLKSGDIIALTSLWLIFPLRFLSEITTAGIYHNGSFISNFFGNILASGFELENLYFPLWISYSMALGFFFVALPNSRYMHIPTEILYIFLKNYGVKLKKLANTYSLVQVYSCSRCGICIDTCQLNKANIKKSQSVYVLKSIRNKNLTDETLFNCLLCGKCQNVCPVGIELTDLRITQRIESTLQYNSSYSYLKETTVAKAEVLYFAGCMTHLTPAIIKSMQNIFKHARINYTFMDEEKAPCCGRPLITAGQYDAAEKLIANNKQIIQSSNAKTLVVSCPICYKVFKEDYALSNIEIKHHSEYILELVNSGKLPANFTEKTIVYHDPCDLGRGSNIYEAPRELMKIYAKISEPKETKEDALCCGGSLSNIKISMPERLKITNNAVDKYLESNPDYLVTSCPLCKKNFAKTNKIKVLDIAEIVSQQLN